MYLKIHFKIYLFFYILIYLHITQIKNNLMLDGLHFYNYYILYQLKLRK